MYFFIVLALVAAASNVNAKCPDVRPVNNFDLKSFADGIWYEVGRFPHRAETGGNCGATSYKLQSNDIFTIINTDVANNRFRSIGGAAKLAPDAGNTGKLTYTYPYGAGGSNVDATLWVLGTDYKNYSVNYHCQYDEITNKRQELAWVFSRTKQMNPEAKAAVARILSEATFLDSSKLIWPDFSEDSCKVLV